MLSLMRGGLVIALGAVLAVTLAKPARAHVPYHHLYVADVFLKEVFRFPLQANGLPAATPDLTLQGGLVYPISVAIDPKGNLVVSDAAGQNASAIKTYAPGASGNAPPISQLTLSNLHAPYFMTMDSSGYLYVEDLNAGGYHTAVDLFAPGAKGNDLPIGTTGLIDPQHSNISSLKTDAHGRFYLGALSESPWVFLHPVQELEREMISPQALQPDIVISSNPAQKNIQYYEALIAIEEPQTVYTLASTSFQPPYWELSDFAAHDIFEKPGQRDPIILGHVCTHGAPWDVLISGSYLLFSCNGHPPSVVVYDAHKFGKVQPVAIIGESVLVSPTGITLGP